MKRPPDMSRAQFNAALKRRGWRKVVLWIDIGNGTSVGAVYFGSKLNRRAWLAKAIREIRKINFDPPPSHRVGWVETGAWFPCPAPALNPEERK